MTLCSILFLWKVNVTGQKDAGSSCTSAMTLMFESSTPIGFFEENPVRMFTTFSSLNLTEEKLGTKID